MNQPTRVLHLHFGKDGGAERFFVNLAQAFARRGVEQKFIFRPDRIWKSEVEMHGEVIENNFRRLTLSGNLMHFRVRRLCKDWRPHAIMAWMPRAARLLPNWDDAVKFARLGDYPKTLKHFSNCDALVGNTPQIAAHCRDLGWDRPALTISNFARPIAINKVQRNDFGTPQDAFLVSAVGRFVNRKGMDLVIRAVAKIPDAWLWLIGDGKERDQLQQLVHSEGISDRTRFIGWVAEPSDYIAASDAFAVASRHEPLGNVILEGWHANVPIVSTKSEGPSWYMKHGENGLMVDIDDVDQLAAGLGELRNSQQLCAKLVQGGQATLETMFSEDRIVSDYLRLFHGDLSDPMAGRQ